VKYVMLVYFCDMLCMCNVDVFSAFLYEYMKFGMCNFRQL